MAHFAKLGVGNEVTQVVVVENSVILDENNVEQESLGQEFLRNLYNEPYANWKKTSYNTYKGQYYENGELAADQSQAFRKNFAENGMIYDESLDAFIEKERYPSWTFNSTTGCYDPPVAKPDDGRSYLWNELTNEWVLRSYGDYPVSE